MEELKSYIIGNIDYGQLCKAFEAAQHLKVPNNWDGYLSSIVNALIEIKLQIINASKQTAQQLNRGQGSLGPDPPTDIMWVISIILALRTIGILESKARDSTRLQENRDAHRLLVDDYLNLIKQLTEKRNDYVALFPHGLNPLFFR